MRGSEEAMFPQFVLSVSNNNKGTDLGTRVGKPARLVPLIVLCISILSWFIAPQGHETNPDGNDLPHLKMAGFDSPTGGWF